MDLLNREMFDIYSRLLYKYFIVMNFVIMIDGFLENEDK